MKKIWVLLLVLLILTGCRKTEYYEDTMPVPDTTAQQTETTAPEPETTMAETVPVQPVPPESDEVLYSDGFSGTEVCHYRQFHRSGHLFLFGCLSALGHGEKADAGQRRSGGTGTVSENLGRLPSGVCPICTVGGLPGSYLCR